MPALLTTHLVDEVPVVAIIGEDSPLTTGVERLFIDAGFLVRVFSPRMLQQEREFLSIDWYKIVWINVPDNWITKEYLLVCEVLARSTKPLLVVLPVATTIAESQTNQDSEWYKHSQLQTQVLVDCNYYLQSASFVFVRDLVDEEQYSRYSSALDFIVQDLEDNHLLRVGGSISPQTVAHTLTALSSLLFKTTATPSTQVLGKKVFVKSAVEQIQKEYNTYYGVSLYVYESTVQTQNPLPFSTKTIEVSSQETLGTFIRTLPIVAQKNKGNKHLDETQLPLPQDELKPPNITHQPPEKPPAHLPTVSELLATGDTPRSPQPKAVVAKAETVKEDLQKIFQTTRLDTKTEHIQELVKTHITTTKKTKRKKSFFYVGIGIIGIGLGVLFLAGTFIFTTLLLKKEVIATMDAINTGDLAYGNQLKKLTNIVSFQVNNYSAVFSLPELTKTTQLVEVSEKMMSVVDNQGLLDQDQSKLAQIILGNATDGENVDTTTLVTQLQQKTQENFETTSYLQGLLDAADFQTTSDLSAFMKNLNQTRDTLLIKQQFFSLVPSLFPENGRKTYAILFQNDQELRPTGGFIQAVGFITVENGQIVAVSTKSSYEIDKAMLGETTPPPNLTRYLGEKRFYFHDSNWSPDYPASAKQAQWFVEQATNQQVAGVVAINTRSLSTILEATGPVDLSTFNEVITAKNLQERMEFHSEVTLVENSGLPDYSSSLLKKVLEKIQSLPEEKSNVFGAALVTAASQQQLLLYSDDSSVQAGWQALGWSGGIVSPQCPTQLATTPCLVEPVAQIETNVGINKANYYLERSINHQVTLEDRANVHKRTITYVNTARSEAWPKGSYKSFVRFLLPKNTTTLEVSISGTPIPNSQIERWEENERVGVGFYLEVPISQSREVFLSFTTPREENDNYSYVFFDQKQPGSDNTPFSLELVNKKHTPLAVAPQAKVLENSISFSQDQLTHLFFGAQY